jgi:hypothetical protein
MVDTNLILVDGLPGSGKSSTAQILWLHLLNHNHEVDWFYEHQISHPIFPLNFEHRIYLMMLNQPWSGAFLKSSTVLEYSLRKWQTLANSLQRTRRIGILESTFFQTMIGWLQLLNLSRGEILRYAARVQQSIEKVHPVLVYLYQADPVAALRSTRAQRGDWFEQALVRAIAKTPYGRTHRVGDFEGVIRFLLTVRSITDEIYEHSSFRKIALDTTGRNWSDYLDRILCFLSLPRIDQKRAVPTDLHALTGTYQTGVLWRKQSLTLSADEHGLFFPDAQSMRLLHKAATTFCIQGMRVEVSFRVSNTHVEMECAGDLPNVPRLWRKVATQPQ